MPDREKVIKGLYLCERTSAGRYDGYEPDYESCFKCPYRGDDLEPDVCCAKLMKDALELLREQEPVEPRKILPCITRPVGGYVCGHCGIRFLEKNDYYCPNCGREVKRDA